MHSCIFSYASTERKPNIYTWKQGKVWRRKKDETVELFAHHQQKATSDKSREAPVAGWETPGGKQEMAGKDRQTNFCTDQQKGQMDRQHQSDRILRKGGDRICGSTGELCNPMKLPRALRTRFAWP